MFRNKSVTIAVSQKQTEFDTFKDPPASGGSAGPITVDFSKLIKKPKGPLKFAIALTGFGIEWPGQEHLFYRMFCRTEIVDIDQDARTCAISVAAGLRDFSPHEGEWDDKYDGHVHVRVMACDDSELDVYVNSRRFRFSDAGDVPRGDQDLLQLNRSKANIVPLLTGFELQYEDDHSVQKFHASVAKSSASQSGTTTAVIESMIGVNDNENTRSYGGIVDYTVLAFPNKLYPFQSSIGGLEFSGQTGSQGKVDRIAEVVGAQVKDEQVFWGLTAADHVFTNKEHPLRFYRVVSSLPAITPDGSNSKLRFELVAGIDDNSPSDPPSFDDPFDVKADIGWFASPD